MGNGLRIICKKEKQEWYCPQAYHSRFLAIPSAFVLLPGFSDSIPDVGGGQSPQKAINTMSYLLCKKTQKMYKIFSHGYTVNRRYLRQQQNHKFDSKILHIYFLSGRFIFQRHKNFYSLQKTFQGTELFKTTISLSPISPLGSPFCSYNNSLQILL